MSTVVSTVVRRSIGRTRGSGRSARPVVLFVSAVADRKGGAETVLLDLLRNPAIQPVLAVPEQGQLAAAGPGDLLEGV
jgi:hypothetical protein